LLKNAGTAEVHRSHILAHDLPIVIQIVDTEERVQRLLPVLEEMMDEGLIAMSNVNILRVQKTAKA
jgi:PII-like signaling protein